MIRCELYGCHEPAHWRTEGVDVCEEHCREALLHKWPARALVDGQDVHLDEDGEISVAE